MLSFGTSSPHKEEHRIPRKIEVNPYLIPNHPTPTAPQPTPEKAPELVPA